MNARDVIADVLCDPQDVKARYLGKPCSEHYDEADAILSALKAAGYGPPMPTGRLHKALQDAFQSGINSMMANCLIKEPKASDYIPVKHAYCDGALRAMLEAAKDE